MFFMIRGISAAPVITLSCLYTTDLQSHCLSAYLKSAAVVVHTFTLKGSSLSLHVKIGSQHPATSPFQARKPFLLITFKTLTRLEDGFRRRPQPRYCVRQGEDTDEQSTEDNIEKGKPSSLRRQSCYADADHQ